MVAAQTHKAHVVVARCALVVGHKVMWKIDCQIGFDPVDIIGKDEEFRRVDLVGDERDGGTVIVQRTQPVRSGRLGVVGIVATPHVQADRLHR
jgi:hypothetical protein